MDPDHAQMTDFICDFCHSTWEDDRPMVEGHRGSLICRYCLDLAFRELWINEQGLDIPADATCILCLSHNGDPAFLSPAFDGIYACKRCVKQAVVMLERDPDYGYERPAAN